MNPGDKPWTMVDLKRRLQDLWSPVQNWLFPAHFQFDSMDDRAKVWNSGSWLAPGTLRLQKWIPDFHPYSERLLLTDC